MQRFATEHKLRLIKLRNIFATRVCMETLGGLPGMLLTVADMGCRDMAIHAGPGLADFMFACRHFLRR